MTPDARVLPFSVWVERTFGSGIVLDHHDDSDLELPSIVALEYSATLFERSAEILQGFSDSTVAMGLNRIVREGDNEVDALFEARTSDSARIRFVDSIEHVYTGVFAARCQHLLAHLDEDGHAPLNSVCYMWWDTFPTWGTPKKPQFSHLDNAILRLLERLLSIQHDACLESALHGLGHWQLHYAERVEAILDGFLSRATDLRAELREYALRARSGMVL